MKKRICVILCAMGCLLLAGCSKDKNESTIQLFYLNPEGNALVQREYSLVEENDLELATVEILDVLQKPEDVKDVQSPIPPTITGTPLYASLARFAYTIKARSGLAPASPPGAYSSFFLLCLNHRL